LIVEIFALFFASIGVENEGIIFVSFPTLARQQALFLVMIRVN